MKYTFTSGLKLAMEGSLWLAVVIIYGVTFLWWRGGEGQAAWILALSGTVFLAFILTVLYFTKRLRLAKMELDEVKQHWHSLGLCENCPEDRDFMQMRDGRIVFFSQHLISYGEWLARNDMAPSVDTLRVWRAQYVVKP